MVALVAGCAGKGDVDRTQPDKIEKAIFFNADGTPKPFYYRYTIVDVPPTNSWAFEGAQGQMEKITFRITEDQLIGYRAYDYAPGSQNAITGGANNSDTPVVSFKIRSHFDVKRDYNPGTGEQSNVIAENTTDRPWNQREFMRVDWTTDKISNPFMDIALQSVQPNLGQQAVSEVEITNPGRAIYTKDYLDVSVQVVATPDYNACMKLFAAPDDGGPWGCGAAKIGLRHSFLAVPSSEYEPLEYPDNIPYVDKSGNPLAIFWGSDGNPHPCDAATLANSAGATAADCSRLGAEEFSKFGYFRTVRQNYDARLGSTEAGRKYYANRWNIWEKTIVRGADGKPSVDANGNVVRLPEEMRTARQITYYANVEFPTDDPLLWSAAQEVVSQWNDAAKQTVAALQATNGDTKPTVDEATMLANAGKLAADVFVLKKNSCNVDGIKAHLSAHADLAKELKAATGIAAADIVSATLVQACTAAESLTQGLPSTDAKKFAWQRNGDLRYSFVYWVDRPQGAGPLGYGPSSPDPETGEIVSASLYLYGAALNTYAQFAADSVDLLNRNVSTDDLLSGKRIADVLRETAANRTQRNNIVITPEARAYASTMATTGGVPGVTPGNSAGSTRSRLVRTDPVTLDQKLKAIQGTDLEALLVNDDILSAFVPSYVPGRTKLSSLTPAQLAQASPTNWLSPSARESRRERFQKLAINGCLLTTEFADDAILGTAIKLSNLSGDQLFKTLRATIFHGLAGHEMGHTMGLRHNFAGSTDALNYGKTYWDIRSNVAPEQWSANGLEEHQYSTVMDYGARFNTDNQGLGRYDLAAFRFGYGQLIDTMPTAADFGNSLSSNIFLNDYSKIPDMVGGAEEIHRTAVTRYARARALMQSGLQNLAKNQGSFSVVAERPYKFCSDEFEGNLDCKTWDMGANQTEIVNNVIDQFKNYYVFNAYQRGRVTWSINGYLTRLLDRYFNRFGEAFQFYYYYADSFPNTDLADDMLRASTLALNTLGEVLQTPEPGPHCATDGSPDVLIVAAGTGSQTCRNDAPQMTITVPEGKPYFIDFSNDYYYRITRAGSLYEKLAALMALTTTQSRFFRVDDFASQDLYSINYYRLFKDQMLNLISGVIRNDPTTYGGYVSGGKYMPTPVVDLATLGQVKPVTPEYMLPSTKRVDTPVNRTIRYYALALSLAQLDSTWDNTLDFSTYINVTLKGSSDDVSYAPGTVVYEFAHPVSKLVYRAAQLDPSRPGIGVAVVQELNQLVGAEGVAGTLSKRYGTDGTGQPLPNWYSAKALVAAAKNAGNQSDFTQATAVFNYVDFLVNYRVDLLGDIRTFRKLAAR